MTIGDVNALISASPVGTAQLPQKTTVWVLGSYSELDAGELMIARKLVAALGSGIGARRIRLVSGKSDMLDELAANCRNVAMAMNPRGPLPIILDGKLRQTDLRVLFDETIIGIPDLAIVIGGGVSRGRVAEECEAAKRADIPVLPVPITGGAARLLRLTAHIASDVYEAVGQTSAGRDTNDFVVALLNAVERYAPSARKESRSIEQGTTSKIQPSNCLTRLEIDKLVNRYIGVSGGYLGDFSYRTHKDFYIDLDLDIDPYNYDGTTRERFTKIISESTPEVQARILEGILERFAVASSELRTQKQRDEIAGWIARLKC
jgi:hypothetical protein